MKIRLNKDFDSYMVTECNKTSEITLDGKILGIEEQIRAEEREKAIDELLNAMKKSIISLEVRDNGADYSSIYRWVEVIAEGLKG